MFSLYDFDKDGLISKEDVRLLLSHTPIECRLSNPGAMTSEGKFTQEGGGNEDYIDRAQSQDELSQLLGICFDGVDQLNFEDFCEVVQRTSSELFLCVYSVVRTHLPSLAGLQRQLAATRQSTALISSPTRGHDLGPAGVLAKFSPTTQLHRRSRHPSPAKAHELDGGKGKGKLSSREEAKKLVVKEPQVEMTSARASGAVLEELFCECGKPLKDLRKRLCASCVNKRVGTRIEGYLIKATRSKSELAKFWVAIEYQDIYCMCHSLHIP